MRLQIASAGIPLTALVTGEQFLPTVPALVRLQVVPGQEDFAAHLARVQLVRPKVGGIHRPAVNVALVGNSTCSALKR